MILHFGNERKCSVAKEIQDRTFEDFSKILYFGAQKDWLLKTKSFAIWQGWEPNVSNFEFLTSFLMSLNVVMVDVERFIGYE